MKRIGGALDYAQLAQANRPAMSAAAFARRYCELGLALTWSPPGQKGPRHAGWNRRENAITSPAAALAYWSQHRTHGIGALLSYSGLVSLDVDDANRSRQVLQHFGIDLDALAARAPCIVGRPERFRLMFRAPEIELQHKSVAWPKQDKPRESFVLFELRAGAISDALPPTIHAGTGAPYRWAVPPREGFPPLPQRLLELWTDWKATDAAARSLCPWWTPPKPRPVRSPPAVPIGESVIARFNDAHDVVAILAAHGYIERGRNRFAPPDSQHAAGLVVAEGKVFCHHVGDPLFESEKRPRDAFDVWCVLEHDGDMRRAVRAAAEILGLRRQRLVGRPPSDAAAVRRAGNA